MVTDPMTVTNDPDRVGVGDGMKDGRVGGQRRDEDPIGINREMGADVAAGAFRVADDPITCGYDAGENRAECGIESVA